MVNVVEGHIIIMIIFYLIKHLYLTIVKSLSLRMAFMAKNSVGSHNRLNDSYLSFD